MDRPFRLVPKAPEPAQDPPPVGSSSPTTNSIEVWRPHAPFLEIDQFVARANVWPPQSVSFTVSAHYERLGKRLTAMWRLFWFGDTHTTIVITQREAQRLADYLRDITT